jgi:hypothetical protein
MDYYITNYGDVIGRIEKAGTYSDCEDHCKKNSTCKYFTYNTSNRKCWLKKMYSEAKTSNIAISGRIGCDSAKKKVQTFCRNKTPGIIIFLNSLGRTGTACDIMITNVM